jgi:CRP-like cAMP-binding protein
MRAGLREQHISSSQLRRIPLFEAVPEEALLRLERGAVPMEPRDGAELFAQGAPADAVYAVTGGEGCVRIGAIDRRSKKLMVEVFRANDIFGEVGVLDGRPRTAAATVDGRVRLLRISGSAFMALLNETPLLGAALSRALAQRLRRTFELFQDATFEPLEVRLARQLLYLAEMNGRRVEGGIVVRDRLRQSDLADLLGATPRSIITILNDWRGNGLVHYDTSAARLTISDPPRMRALIEAAE